MFIDLNKQNIYLSLAKKARPLDKKKKNNYTTLIHCPTALHIEEDENEMEYEQQFATAINCMDGRTQLPVLYWLRDYFDDQYLVVDTITEPGADSVLFSCNPESIARDLRISYDIHGSRLLVIVGHEGCAGNPVSRKQHHTDITKCVNMVSEWKIFSHIFGLWVYRNDEKIWLAEAIYEIKK